MSHKDPWSRSILDSSPSPSPSDDDDTDFPSGFHSMGNNDLLAELDLSRREDYAIVTETPFSIARRKQQYQENVFCGSIKTAEDTMKEQTVTPGDNETNNWRNHSGWLDAQGRPISDVRGSRKGNLAKGVTTQLKPKAFTPLKRNGSVTLPKRKKKKANSDDKVEFRALPPAASSSGYPIVAALQRQASLPAKRQRKRAAKPKRVATPTPVQTKLDVDLLVRGTRRKEAKGEDMDVIMEDMVGGHAKKSASPKVSGHSFTHWVYNKEARATREQQPVTLDTPPSSNAFIQASQIQISQESMETDPGLPSPPPSSSPILHVPKPEKASWVANLEAMADGYPFSKAADRVVSSSRTQPSPGVSPSYPEEGFTFYVGQNPLEQHQSLNAYPHQSYHQPQPTQPFQDDNSHTAPYERYSPTKQPKPYGSRMNEPNFDIQSQPRGTAFQHNSYSSQNGHSYANGHAYNESHSAPSNVRDTVSATRQRSHNSAPTRQRSHNSAPSRWAKLLPSQPEEEWSTTRKCRLTIPPNNAAPKYSAPKWSTFRLPKHAFERENTNTNAIATPVSKLTVWAPTPRTPQTASPTTQYVPPGIRALHTAATAATHRPTSTQPDEDWEAAWTRSANIASWR